ncbi:MAG: helix-turn-helix domain-containing protein [Thermodesulfobacteriota bacterium]
MKAMQKSNGNRSQAARLLKIPRHVLIYRLEKFELS